MNASKRTFGAHWLAFLPAIERSVETMHLLAMAVRTAHEAGATLFELACQPINGLDPTQTAAALSVGGINEIGYCRFFPDDLSCGDPIGNEREVASAVQTFSNDLTFIEKLADRGIRSKYITGPSCFVLGRQYPNKTRIVEAARDFYNRFDDRIKRLGLTVCLEYLRPVEDFAVENLGAVQEITSGFSWLRWHGDIFHMLERRENPGQIIRQAGPLLGYLHAHGTKRVMPGMNAGTSPDEWDHVDWTDIASALNEISYEGPIVPEPFGEPIRQQLPVLGKGLPPAMDPSLYYRGALDHFRKVGILPRQTTP